MGVFLALLAMASFAANILITRYAVARMPLEAGFLIVLAINVLFPALLFPVELGTRATPWAWDWKGAGLFILGGVIGTFLGRRFLFDAVKLLGPSRASVFHSTAPAFALIGAWLLAGENLGWLEIGLMALVWFGLWLTQPRAGGMQLAGQLSPAQVRAGMIAGLLTVAGFGFGNVFRGLAMRGWDEAIAGSMIASVAALALQVAVTRNWGQVRAQLRAADGRAIGLYIACGVTTSCGSIFIAEAMARMEIALAVLIVHTTPLLIFPVSVFILKNREELTGRTVAGALLVLAGIAALALR
jgi:drug/metabolite transporter (DMT)-like permease